MFESMELAMLQRLWWGITSVVGSLFLFLSFVQGGQTLLLTMGKGDLEKNLIINSLGRKWELTFTTLVLFGGALFAAFPLFYATSFGGAYWVWIAILFTFVLQAVSYEFRKKPGNLLGAGAYEFFLFVNGSLGILLIGVAVGTFFTGSNFSLNVFNHVTWQHPLRGLEAAFSLFNVTFGLFLVFHARVLGALYLNNNIELVVLTDKTRAEVLKNFLLALPFLLFVLINLVTMDGFTADPVTGAITMEKSKYLHNLLAMPAVVVLLLGGLVFVILGVVLTAKGSRRGIWPAGVGTVFVGLAIFFLAGYNNTAFYPSKTHLPSSLTIHNASSSHYTLVVMSYVAIAVPFVLAYIGHFWFRMDKGKITEADVTRGMEREVY